MFEVRDGDTESAENIAQKIAGVFDTLLLTLSDGMGRIWEVRRINDELLNEDEGVDLARLTYQYRHEKPRSDVLE
jgi:hypothetical protein